MSDNEHSAAGPYGQAWEPYRAAGWAGVLPLPVKRKGPPPAGFTGWAGVDPSGADIWAWLEDGRGAGNVGLHMPSGLYGLDVDAYGAKTGAAALASLVERLGPLPSTWIVSSRDDGVSGIRLYAAALPPGRVWLDEPGGHGAGIESVHKGHRYAVAWPSVHPDTGRVYTWRHENAEACPSVAIPRADELPELPAAWIEALSRPGEVRAGTQAGHDETVAAVACWRDDEPCERVTRAAERARAGLAAGLMGAALHPAAEAATWELACLGHEGHAGAKRALAEHYAGHVAARAGRDGESARADAEAEWWRLVRGAVGKLDPSAYRAVCDCGQWSGEGLTFTPEDLGVTYSPPGVADAFSDPAGVEVVAVGDIDGPRSLRSFTVSPRELMARPRPDPIVSGLLYRDTLSWLIGKSGSFKSFVALDLAAAVADENGRKWLGRPVYGGAVMYVAAEGAGGMGLRVQAWTVKNGEMSERVAFLTRAVQIKSDGWGVLVEMAREIMPALIVLDTQARISVGVNENSNTEIGEMIAKLDELRRATRACVLVVHHIGRSGEDARGASALDGAQDTELKLERVGGPKSMRVRLTVDKQKDAPDTSEIMIDLESIDLGRDELTGEALSSLVLIPDLVIDPFPTAPWHSIEILNANQKMICEVLRELFDEGGGTRSEVAGAWRERGGWTGGGKWPKNTFYRAWDELLKKDIIGKIEGSQRFRLITPGD